MNRRLEPYDLGKNRKNSVLAVITFFLFSTPVKSGMELARNRERSDMMVLFGETQTGGRDDPR